MTDHSEHRSAHLVWPAESRCADESVAGGKGAKLAQLTQLGFRVPSFFVVATSAPRQTSAVGPASVPAELRRELIAAATQLGSVRLAVRSSAVGEDSGDASYAGIFDTVLSVAPGEVPDAVERCWKSSVSVQADDYRRRRGIAGPQPMAVVVQVMVQPDWSGVCFTADPVSGALSDVLVDAAPDVGENLVAGAINPEHIRLDAATGKEKERIAGDHIVPVPPGVIRSVWLASIAVAKQMGYPQDVEWAANACGLHLLQTRPITSIDGIVVTRALEPWRDEPTATPDDPARTWTRAYADEIWAPPISPLFYQVHNLTPTFATSWRWHHDRSPLPPDVFKYFRACAYVDTAVLARHYSNQPRVARTHAVLDLFPRAQREGVLNTRWRWRGRLARAFHLEVRHWRTLSLRRNSRYLDSLWPEVVRQTDEYLDLDLDALSLDKLAQHRRSVLRLAGSVGAVCNVAVSYHSHDVTLLLIGLLQRWRGSGDVWYARLSSGLERSETVAEAQAIWQLATRIRALGPEAVNAARTSRWSEFGQSSTIFAHEFETFWRAHRHRGANYKDLVHPRWGDDHELLFDVVRGYLDEATPAPVELNQASARARRAAETQLYAELRGPLGWLRRGVLRILVVLNAEYLRQRDNHRFYYDRFWHELRRIYLSYGRRLASTGVLECASDVFFLGTDEIKQAMSATLSGAVVARLVGSRRRDWERTRVGQAPRFLQGWNSIVDDTLDVAPALADAWTGIAASPGRARGVARVVWDASDLASVGSGDIVVARQADPGWAPVFARIGGLVLETGGVLAHGASLCREYSLPCVVAVQNATSDIPDGALIEISGEHGTVRVLG